MQKQQITNISGESKYHSFLLAKTESKQIAEKWDHYILSVDGRLLMNTDEPKTTNNQQSYNFGVDSFACMFQDIPHYKFVLGQSKWLEKCLKTQEVDRLASLGALRYDSLSVANSISFYYYLISRSKLKSHHTNQLLPDINNKFIKIKPKYILSCDCLIFEINDSNKSSYNQATNITSNNLSNQFIQQAANIVQFKKIPRNVQTLMQNYNKVYSFKSQYALLSDIHFLNCLVRGKRNFASYLKKGDTYQFFISDQIRNKFKSLYSQPKL